MVYKDKDLILLKHLRNNAREPLTRISRRTKIPVSTLFDRIRVYEKNYISKHTSLLNFKSLGYDIKVHLLLKTPNKRLLKEFLLDHRRINNLFRINNGFDFLVEGVFHNIRELDRFYAQLDQIGVQKKLEFIIMEDLAREVFFTK